MTERKSTRLTRQQANSLRTKYKPEYCQALVDHMAEGNTFASFAANLRVNRASLYVWLQKHKAFAQARDLGEPMMEAYLVRMGKMIATGQLRRLKSEKVMVDEKGQPMRDPQTGKWLMEREYEGTSGNSTAWIFMMKNMCGWRDRRDVEHSGDAQRPIALEVSAGQRRAHQLTLEQQVEEADRLRRQRLACAGE